MCAGLGGRGRVAAMCWLTVVAVALAGVSATPLADAGTAGASTAIDGGHVAVGIDDGALEGGARRQAPLCPAGPTDATQETADKLASEPSPGVRIAAVYPNPTTHRDVGEYLVLSVPERTTVETLTLETGSASTSVTLPTETVDGRIALSTAPNATENLTGHRVIALEGHLPLSNEGSTLTLRAGGEGDDVETDAGVGDADGAILDRIDYGRAPPAEQWYRASLEQGAVGGDERGDGVDSGGGDGDGGVWWPRGATCRTSLSVTDATATAFVLPDSPDVAVDVLESAEERIYLGGYTFTDERTTRALEGATERGVDVEVLLEAGPVGGTPETTARLLDDLEAAGATVRVVGGEHSRYPYHHPKYAVVDDRALVTTENWKPSGIGGTSSRGWGVVLENETVAEELATVFRADAAGPDVRPWSVHRETARFVEGEPAGTPFPETTEPDRVPVDRVDVVLAPDNAESEFRALLRGANDSIDVAQNAIGSDGHVLLEESLAAARRGVEVRILLDASWYVEEENSALADRLERTAAAEDLPLEVRLADSSPRFEKLHAKGVIVDGEVAVVGSVNWNDNSLRENREVALVLYGEAAAGYYRSVFEADWTGDTWTLPLELLLLAVLALALAALVGARYLEFEPAPLDDPGTGVGYPELGVGDDRAGPATEEPGVDPATEEPGVDPATRAARANPWPTADATATPTERTAPRRAGTAEVGRPPDAPIGEGRAEPRSSPPTGTAGRREDASTGTEPDLSSRWHEESTLEPIEASAAETSAGEAKTSETKTSETGEGRRESTVADEGP